MNDQLQQALAVVLQGATDAVSSGVSFLKAELPDVIHQLLLWKMAQSIITAALAVAIASLVIWMFLKVSKAKEVGVWLRGPQWSWEVGNTYSALSYTVWIVGGFVFLACVMSAASDVLRVVQIWVAPKIYLIEYAARLAGGK